MSKGLQDVRGNTGALYDGWKDWIKSERRLEKTRDRLKRNERKDWEKDW